MPLAVAVQRDTGGSQPPITYPRELWTWMPPIGDQIELTRFVDNLEVERGMNGRYSPPTVIQSQVVPQTSGQVIIDVRHDIRELDLPLVAIGSDVPSLQAVLTQLASSFNTRNGVGTLRRTSTLNVHSDLFCYCVSGLPGTSEGTNGPTLHRETLIFQAFDPYWYQQPVSLNFTNGNSQSWFPILPLRLGSSSVLGNTSVTNSGDVEAFPIWTINGPATGATLTNNTTQQTLSLLRPLAAGEQVVIDTRPDFVSVTGPGGANWRRYLTSRSLWTLAPLINNLALNIEGADTSSYINLLYRPRTLAP